MARPEKKTPTTHLKAVETPAQPDTTPPSAVPAAQPTGAPAPNPEVPSLPRRRQFDAEFKRRALAEADAAEPGELGAVLRRYGLYSSHLTTWRRQRDEGALTGLTPRKRGRKAPASNPLAAEVARLTRENQKLLARAERTERLLELQKKVAELFGETLPPVPPELMPPPDEPEPPTRPRKRKKR